MIVLCDPGNLNNLWKLRMKPTLDADDHIEYINNGKKCKFVLKTPFEKTLDLEEKIIHKCHEKINLLEQKLYLTGKIESRIDTCINNYKILCQENPTIFTDSKDAIDLVISRYMFNKKQKEKNKFIGCYALNQFGWEEEICAYSLKK